MKSWWARDVLLNSCSFSSVVIELHIVFFHDDVAIFCIMAVSHSHSLFHLLLLLHFSLIRIIRYLIYFIDVFKELVLRIIFCNFLTSVLFPFKNIFKFPFLNCHWMLLFMFQSLDEKLHYTPAFFFNNEDN